MVVRHPLARLLSEYRYQSRKRGLDFAQLVGFSTWLRYWLARERRRPGIRDNHFRPQTAFRLPYAEVFRHEDGLEQVLARLARVADVHVPPLARENVSPPRPVRVTRGDLDRIAAFHAADFETFGYDPRPDATEAARMGVQLEGMAHA